MTLQNFTLGTFAQQGVAGSFESIATTTVGAGGAADVTFSSIPSTYSHLQIRCLVRGTTAATTVGFDVQFNSDTGNNYSIHQLYGDGTSAAAYADATEPDINISSVPAASASANIFGVAVVDILDYTSLNKYKTVRMLNGWDANGSGLAALFSGLWRNTSIAAIDTIKLFPSAGNFAQYSHFALYGIKAA